MKININKIASVLVPAAACMALTSCNDWLSVHPDQEIEDTELFTTQNGFKEALAGVYSSMVNENTYSKEMTFGTLGVLAQEWDNYPAVYKDLALYDYDAASSQNYIGNIWSTSYNSIANVNNILKHIDGKENLFYEGNFNIIKGEALALRAMLHFDLLRCFGVSYAVNPNQPAIPYCTDLTYRVFPQLTVKEVAEKVSQDLKDAEELLKVDPILTGREITEWDDNGYLLNRTMHLNYYAVKALQARVAMWTGNYADALAAANVVLNSGKFEWATQDDMSRGFDRSMVNEQVFGLNNVNLTRLGDSYFNESYNSNSFSLKRDNQLAYYNNETTDLRYLFLFKSGETGEYIDYRYPVKFVQSESSDPYFRNKMPMIRIGELVLIKAEVNNRLNGTGLDDLNELRVARNLAELETLSGSFEDELVRQYRAELLGEGQYFFLLKRLNKVMIPRAEEVDAVSQKVYTFPLPISETDVAQRQPNR